MNDPLGQTRSSAITIITWKLFCEILKSGHRRTCENSDLYRPDTWIITLLYGFAGGFPNSNSHGCLDVVEEKK